MTKSEVKTLYDLLGKFQAEVSPEIPAGKVYAPSPRILLTLMIRWVVGWAEERMGLDL